ncbi:MAG: hypothetical protein ABT01_04055 [Clostridium sp. SCN 57-10]|nr:MAG: hypothetical protein ABT01_04055 [Clostridium sp. SCN 57-10]
MAKIWQLPPQIYNLIAAGEVVERPGSVVKELLENSIDAGATRITVEMRNGGITYLRVTDNGCGIERDDVRTAFLRHATSKIRSAGDLAAIGTFGFRGEALAAVASVSKIDLFTRTSEAAEGTQITIEGGEETAFTETGCPVGTTVIMRELFYNVPARMKYLKKDTAEAAFVETSVIHTALARPDVAITLIRDGRELFAAPGDGKLSSAIHAVYGREIIQSLLSTVGAFGEISVKGYISPPSVTRGTRSMQAFFVNGRYIRSRLLTAALDEAYKGKLMAGRAAVCIVHLIVNPASVDINVHPAKLEARFFRERDVFSALCGTVTAALDSLAVGEQHEAVPARRVPPPPREDTVKPNQQAMQLAYQTTPFLYPESQKSSFAEVAASAPAYTRDASLNAPAHSGIQGYKANVKPISFPYQTAERPLQSSPEPQPAAQCAPVPLPPEQTEPSAAAQSVVAEHDAVRLVGEVFATYIIAENCEGMWLIDKHAAHEKIMFNTLLARGEQGEGQLLVEPLSLVLSRPEKAACLAYADDLRRVGFEVEDFGSEAVLVRQIPQYLDEQDVPFVLSELAEKLKNSGKTQSSIYEELLKSVACKAAIKAGSDTGAAELARLARRVLSEPDIKNCPHGRPVAVLMSKYQLEKLFKRN